uniref:Uncharacterized protein n=1 Tax=Anguilla anguilla TaxID=7936 RepID=A0A0E9TCX5_ANGAN
MDTVLFHKHQNFMKEAWIGLPLSRKCDKWQCSH